MGLVPFIMRLQRALSLFSSHEDMLRGWPSINQQANHSTRHQTASNMTLDFQSPELREISIF